MKQHSHDILKPILILLVIIFMTGCTIRNDSSYRTLIPAAEGFAHTFIDTRFDMYVNELGLSDYFITETVYGSNGFEKAYRFKSADGTERTWGCRVCLQSFKMTGARNNKILDFVVLEEGEEYGAALMEKTFFKAFEAAPGVNVSKEETVTVTFPAGWNWVRAGEYFRDHKDEISLESEALHEYVKSSVKRIFTNETIDSITVQDDLSVSLMLNTHLQKTCLENSVAGLNQSVREYERHHGDGVQMKGKLRIKRFVNGKTFIIFIADISNGHQFSYLRRKLI